MKITATQLRVLQRIAEVDETAWRPGNGFSNLRARFRRRPTIDALKRRGLIERTDKRLGAGWSHAYLRLTEAGRHALGSSAPTPASR